MTGSPADFPLPVLVERIDQLRRDMNSIGTRQDRAEDRLQLLAVLPDRVASLTKTVDKIDGSIDKMAAEWQQQDQFRQQFNLQVQNAQNTRVQNIKSSYLTLIIFGGGVFMSLIGILSQVLFKAVTGK